MLATGPSSAPRRTVPGDRAAPPSPGSLTAARSAAGSIGRRVRWRPSATGERGKQRQLVPIRQALLGEHVGEIHRGEGSRGELLTVVGLPPHGGNGGPHRGSWRQLQRD